MPRLVPPRPRALAVRTEAARTEAALTEAAPALATRAYAWMLSPWARFTLLVVLLAASIAATLAWEPQRLLDRTPRPSDHTLTAVLLFTVAYGLATVAFVPRPLLNAAAGAWYGIHAGFPAAIGGTVLGAGLAFLLGRSLGRDAVRPLLRGRFLLGLDRQLSGHGFRSILAMRLFPGVPFSAANYAAAVSRVRLTPFLVATAAGSAANTAAYVVAGSRATSPASPVFLLALGFLGVTAVAAAAFTRSRGRGRGRSGSRTDGTEDASRVNAPADSASRPTECA